jgi:hypothetical protein
MDQKYRDQIEELIKTLGDECRPRRLAYYSVRFRVKFNSGELGWTGSLPLVSCCSAAAHKEALYEIVPSVELALGDDKEIVGLEIKQDHIHFEGEKAVLDGEKVCDSETLAPADAAMLGIDMAGNPVDDDCYDKDLQDQNEDSDGDEWKNTSD